MFKKISLALAVSVAIIGCGDGTSRDSGGSNIGPLIDSSEAVDQISENAFNGDETGITLNAIDRDGDTITYSLSDDASGRFTVNPESGAVTVADESNIDFEQQASHHITAVASSADGSTSSANFTITVTDETFASGGDFDNGIMLEAGADLETRLLQTLITAQPKTVVVLPKGKFDFVGEISSSVDDIIIRGRGMKADTGTTLNFKQQTTGGQSLLVTGNNFTIADIAIEDSPGDAIKITDTNGVTIQRVRVEWTNGPDTNNGAYGLYPVQTKNVLIEDSEVRGASDAGVYVGQSENIIVRRNLAYENVAGIEIENSKFADVYDNEATGNTGGILVFDLPGPPVQGGEATRVFNNNVYDNNEPNFAPQGNIVGTVPGGTGIMVMANDDIEVFGNTITDNGSAGIIVVSYYITDAGVSKATYDPVPERIYIHDNVFTGNAQATQGLATTIGDFVFGGEMVDIFYDSSGVGSNDGLLVEFPNGLTESQRICVQNNGNATFGTVNASVLLNGVNAPAGISNNLAPFDCAHPNLPTIALDDLSSNSGASGNIDAAVLCANTAGDNNLAASNADCPNLSDYRLFSDAADPTTGATKGVKYDLTSPLFSDYTAKHRFIFTPDGLQGAYRSTGVMDLPVGTIISKTFSVKSDLRDATSSEELIETRLLIRRNTGWKALPYIWNADKTDAVLSLTGGSKNISWIDAQGVNQNTAYDIPNANNCAQCHGSNELKPIGPKANLLNRDFDYGSGPVNQLTHMAAEGFLTGVPSDLSGIETIPHFADNSASLNDRARGYLDINCAHCHNPDGAGSTSGLYLEYERAFGLDTGECKPPVAAGDGTGNLGHDIVPGDAATSIVVFRMNSNETAVRMPEIGRSVIHSEGVDVVSDWINAMPANNCSGS